MKNLITIILLLISTSSIAQDYKLTYLQKFGIGEEVYQLNIVDQQTFWRRVSVDVKEHLQPSTPNHTVIHQYKGELDPLLSYAHMDFKSHTMMSNIPFLGRPFYLKDPITKIDWVMQDSTAKVLGMDCQIATCSYLGRDYTAYFTTDIPLSYGPWKLHGLPGLILKVVTDRFTDIDHKEHIVIECLKIEKAPLAKKDKKVFQKFVKQKFVTHDKAVTMADKYAKYFVEGVKSAEAEEYPEDYEGLLAKRRALGVLEIIHPKAQSTGIIISAD